MCNEAARAFDRYKDVKAVSVLENTAMPRWGLRTKWGDTVVQVIADWAEASCPIRGCSGGKQVAAFLHNPCDALTYELKEIAALGGDNVDDEDVQAEIERAVNSAEEIRVCQLCSQTLDAEYLSKYPTTQHCPTCFDKIMDERGKECRKQHPDWGQHRGGDEDGEWILVEGCGYVWHE